MAKPRYAYRLGWRSVKYVAPWLSPAQAKEIADALGPAFHQFHITTPARAAAAIAQMAHESAGFHTTTEYASGAAYNGRRDLGNVHPNDGVRFKGRGYIQITGRNNYSAVGRALKHNFVDHPHDLAAPKWAALASCWWWTNHGCNEFADRKDFIGLTRRINGGTNGLEERQAYYRRARRVGRFLVPKRRKP